MNKHDFYIFQYHTRYNDKWTSLIIDKGEDLRSWFRIVKTIERDDFTGILQFRILDASGQHVWSRTIDAEKSHLHRRYAKKFEVAAKIEECRDGGIVWYGIWQRDCDMAEGTSMGYCAANVYAYSRIVEDLYRDAEGPCSIWIMTPEEADEFRPESRDLALEAYEDGHPHVVSSVRFDEEGSYV